MPDKNDLLSALTRPGSVRFDSNSAEVAALKELWPQLQNIAQNGASLWVLDGSPTVRNTRVKIYPAGHAAFYNPDGRRFLFADPEGNPLHECEWIKDPVTGESKLARARMQLDCRQWLGVKPGAKTFTTQLDLKSQPGWERLTLDDLRKKAAEVWEVPFSEVKYFYKDGNFTHYGEGRYEIRLTKDGLYALPEETFDRTVFISCMFSLNWERLDLIPVVELFQSTLPGSGGAMFELIWGLYDDQSRETPLGPLRYRGLPTYPSKEAFNIFSAFFIPSGPPGEKIFDVFMDPDRSREIAWLPRKDPPWRYFCRENRVCLTVQDHFLYKATVFDDPAAIPYINCARGARPSCQRQIAVRPGSIALTDGDRTREIPLKPVWQIEPGPEAGKPQPRYPFGWRKFFDGNPPVTDPVKALYTVPFYPEGGSEIDESSLQPMVLDQIFYYMETCPDMPEKLEKAERVLVHTFDAAISGCIDSARERQYTALYSDPEFAQKSAQLLWDYAAARNQLGALKRVSFLPEADHVEQAYKEKYGMIFKWIPFLYFQDREVCEQILRSAADALEPGGILFLAGPGPIVGLFEYYGVKALYHDPAVDMPFFRQHLKMCPENRVREDLEVFLAEKL